MEAAPSLPPMPNRCRRYQPRKRVIGAQSTDAFLVMAKLIPYWNGTPNHLKGRVTGSPETVGQMRKRPNTSRPPSPLSDIARAELWAEPESNAGAGWFTSQHSVRFRVNDANDYEAAQLDAEELSQVDPCQR